MNPNDPFDRDNLSPAEALLTEHEIAREFFQGERFDLSADSRSWGILLNYLYQSLPLPEIEP